MVFQNFDLKIYREPLHSISNQIKLVLLKFANPPLSLEAPITNLLRTACIYLKHCLRRFRNVVRCKFDEYAKKYIYYYLKPNFMQQNLQRISNILK